MSQFVKDPSEELDYSVDWTDWLGDDEIATSTWAVPDGLTEPQAASAGPKIATVWLAGGEVGQDYDVVNRITTPTGRVSERTLIIHVLQR